MNKIPDGIEITYMGTGKNKNIDDVSVSIDGKCIVHIEQMDDNHYWMAIYLPDKTVYLHFMAEGKIILTAEEECGAVAYGKWHHPAKKPCSAEGVNDFIDSLKRVN